MGLKWCGSSRPYIMRYAVIVLICVLELTSIEAITTPEEFHFTHSVYNATIYEKAPGKTYLTPTRKMGIYVSDPELEVKYRIFDGDKTNIFRAEEYRVGDFVFLRVRTHTSSHGVLNREFQNHYHLKIKAIAQVESSTTLTATADLIITVADRNDLRPLFDQEFYNVTVSEDAALHSSIVKVTAFDGDIGINSEIYYSLRQWTNTFAIHPTSGVVSLTGQLNYFQQKEYELEISAEDRGPKSSETRSYKDRNAIVKVWVTQKNFFAPEIHVQRLSNVQENEPGETTYAVLNIIDKDIGQNGKIGNVRILDGTYSEHFKIVKGPINGDYDVVIMESLDRESVPNGFNITVEVSDLGQPPKISQSVIFVDISDANDNPPLFSKDVLFASVEEIAPVGTPVIYLHAKDKDVGRNAEILYEIASGNDNGLFRINKNSGLISTAGALNTEINDNVELVVNAVDRANMEAIRKGTVKVNITIVDCNDNAPIFNITDKNVYVDENLPVGSEVYKVEAFDLDQGENSRISFSITNQNSVPFEIDHFTGVMRTTQVLDYESMKRVHKVKISASDWGSPFIRRSEIILSMHVRNVNDNGPLFEKVDCSGYLSREAPIGTELVVITAIDFDNDIINYNIQSGNDDGCFEIGITTGVLTLNCSITEPEGSKRNLVIVASDGIHNSESVSVALTFVNNKRNFQLSNSDANIQCESTNATQELTKQLQLAKQRNEANSDDNLIFEPTSTKVQNRHAPVFTDKIVFNVSEGVSIGTTLFTVSTIDQDPGYAGMVVYVINDGDPYDQFKVNTTDGRLIVMAKLDRETIPRYDIEIVASDLAEVGSRKSASTIVSINVLDENDNAPIFEKNSYEVSVSEGILINSTIKQVLATDRDLNQNGKITYSLLAHADTFAVNKASGFITIKKLLDREMVEVYYLPVKAADNGTVSLASTATVTVTVLDVNDNIPKFIPEIYNVKIREDLPIGTVVTTVTAEDQDKGDNGRVTYRLTYGSDDKFQIDENTGVIRITGKLDFESRQIYNVSVHAEDGGDPPLMSACVINVEIIDVNENLEPPFFSNFVEIGYVKENLPVDSVVMYVSASDPDGIDDGRGLVTYSIRDGSGLGRFSIDNNGTIRTKQVLDRETTSHYWLTVYAQDRGLVPLHARLEVYINVIDVNDNVPQMQHPVYYMQITENSKEGTVVGQVMATDRDENPSQSLTYEITKPKSSQRQFFQINPQTGVISSTKRRIDRDNGHAEHILEVTVSDNGLPNLSSTSRVIIKVLDVNDNKPKFLERLYRVRIPENPAPGKKVPVFQVVAKDNDEGRNRQITYKLKKTKQSKFSINQNTGMIYARGVLTADRRSHELRVRAFDNGEPRLKDSTRVRIEVVKRITSSPNAPQFDQDVINFQVVENNKIGEHVGLVTATDIDADKLWYSITDGDPNNHFSISPEYGSILLADILDWETCSKYNLTVSATDGVHQASTKVVITVLDTNDNTPMFTRSSYEEYVAENSAVGTTVLEVSAVDKDENSRLFYMITSVVNEVSQDKFQIDSETGVVTVKDELDREVLALHELTVMVRDQGTQSNRNFTRVIIHVIDNNDHKPEFLSETIEGRVFETAAIGTSVIQVLAVDQDKGTNAEITYSIESGNVGGMFDIEETMGTISVAKELDRDQQSEYDLIIMATDRGIPPLSSTATVRIYVTISNNAAPKFTSDHFTAELTENCAIGTNVAILEALCQSSVTYEILTGNTNKIFNINPNSGVVYTKDRVDYEDYQFFNLSIMATNIMGLSAKTQLIVHVLDQNDNAPVFDQESHVGNISETAGPGSIVLTSDGNPLIIHASDLDSHSNSFLSYEISDNKSNEYFMVDKDTGAIRTRAALDHELFSEIEFLVNVKDKGSPSLKAEKPAKVVIYVNDVNDNPPVFTESVFNVELLLPTSEKVRVVQVSASDPDTGSGDELSFSIVNGNDDGKFEIDSVSGNIYLKNASNMANNYLLTVRVSDGEFESTANVNITVKSSADSGFIFSQSRYTVHVTENVPGIKTLAVLQITNSQNHHMTYTLLNGQDMFSIVKSSGVLQTKGRQFDREEQERYILVVRVEDKQLPRTANILVDVIIDDVNDNIPLFVNQPYDTVVAVNLQPGQLVRQLTVVDRDEGLNGAIVFSMIRGYQDKFEVTENGGQIRLKRPLDETDQDKDVALLVRASDGGDPPMFSEVEVRIKIISESHPKFDQQFYTTSVKEDVQLHSPVTTVQAMSPNGHKLIYTIVEGDPYKEFSVEFNVDMGSLGPCVITVVSRLDYESTQGYDLIIRASDVKTGAYAETKVRINVEDVNDKAPSFSHYIYTATVSEAISVGTFVVAVQAEDADSKANSKIYYSIAPLADGSTDAEHFEVDSERGLITTSQLLDHETQKEFLFLAVASDSGIPSLNSSVRVHVIVEDLNDNPPYFDRPIYNCEITDQASSIVVTKVSASDPDSCSQGNLIYTIIGGNYDQTFNIDSETGLITLSNRRRNELYHGYTVNVSVSDGVFTSFTRVGITVKNSNNHSPVFQQHPYRALALENMGKGMLITTVSALDEDRGIYGMVTYTIPSDYMRKYFSIDADTGELFSNSLFDREDKDYFVVQVAATDNGGRMGFTTVEVRVTDINDNVPQFLVQEYNTVIMDSSSLNSSVLQIKATDKDMGENGRVTYQMHQSEASEYFTVEQDTGDVLLKKRPQVGKMYKFFVRAMDHGDPQLENNVPVSVFITTGNERNIPVFNRQHHNKRITIPENQQGDSIVYRVTAESAMPITYSIVPGSNVETNFPETFSIDENGNIRLVGTLDAEVTSSYILTIAASLQSSPQITNTVQLEFVIEDINNKIPQFESIVYLVTVSENSPIGSELIQVRAMDADSDAKLEYRYGQDVGRLSEIFHLDPYTGWIILSSELDRETVSEYNLTITVTDVHAPFSQINQTVVRIQVTDHNDNPPIFGRPHYHTAINEDAFPGQILLTLDTTDADSVSDLPVNYFIVQGDPLGKFSIHKTGELYVSRSLDRELVTRYKLGVVATDGGLVSRATVTIDILDANDNSPVCKQPMHTVVLSEDARLSTIITRIKAVDADDQSTRNAMIEYYISDEDMREKFNIDKSKGILTTKAHLDREDVPRYRIVVNAVDGGGRSCDTEVFVELSDVNDNRPVFENIPNPFRMSEHAEVNTLLLRLTALDSDLGINRQVQYRLKYDENGTFGVDPKTGIITLLKSVDREVKPEYHLMVEAFDRGTPSLTSEATLVIALQDENDNPPEFVRNSYSATVKENSQVGDEIITVEATSKDIGINAIMTYSIVGGNAHGRFSINPDKGIITVANKLDRENTAEYVLTIIAEDRGAVPLTGSAYVTINVTDENDNPPLFGLSSYKVNIREDTEVGATVIQVSASDADSPPNAKLTYSIVSGDSLGNFDMDPRDGRIRIRSKLDRETVAQHILIVQVTDSGVPQLFDQTTVTVNVNDANDCPPRFSKDNYTALVQEDRPIGFKILTFTVVDDDLHPNGEPFSFDIIHGNEGGEFRIDGQGILYTAGKFNQDVKDMYELTVRVFDNGNPPLSTDMQVLVKIIEEGSSPPRVENLQISINSYMDKFPGGIIGKLTAVDDDVYDKLSYKVVSSNKHLFDIDKRDGRIIAFKGLDSGEYIVNVSVSDGKNMVYGKVDVEVASITTDMIDNAITVQLQSLHPDDFMRNYKKNFQRSLKRILNVRTRDIEVINVQPADYSHNVVNSRRKRDTTPDDLDILFAVKRSPNSYFRSKPLRKKVIQAIPTIEQALNVRVIKVFSDMCSKNTCSSGSCVGIVEFDEDSLIPVNADGQSFVLAKHYYSYKCVCPDGSESDNCDRDVTTCSDKPCPYYKVCQPDPVSGYQCVCPDGTTGQHCEQSKPDRCTDINCKGGDKPMTFAGKSYAKWTLHETFTIKSRLSLSVRIKTRQANANIKYAKGRVDYSILEVLDGMIQYRFNCGSGEGVVLIPVIINDGKWHTIMVERQGRRAEIFLDSQYSAIAYAPGTNDVLNLDTNDVYFGAEVDVSYTGYQEINRGFDGCMENIKLYHVQLPFKGINAVAVNHEFKAVEFHCKDTYQILTGSNICSSRPCMNGGKCVPSVQNSYFCDCPGRFDGAKCEINKDPCADNPCRNNGVCRNVKDVPNEFVCTCPDNLQGKVCEYGARCLPNPCINGGTCIEGPTSPICRCMGGYSGLYCEKKINACESSPCLNGGTCYNTENFYVCNCTEETRGRNCNEIAQPHITSNKAGITQEELLAIVGVAGGLILLTLLFVAIQCWRRRKNGNRRGNITTGIADDETDVMLRGLKDGKKMCKVSNFDVRMSVQNIPPSPRPPPVPDRPVSYTPSAHDSLNTLNNFDTVRNYGSAADELENCHNIPYQDFLQTFAPIPRSTASVPPSLPPPPPSNPASDTESIQKAPWDDCPNMLENFEEKVHPEKFTKFPGLRPGYTFQETTSFSSLPMSESEDEPDYHWDASDWAPRPSLPNISEVPMTELLESPTSSTHSNDSNTNVQNIQNNDYDLYTDPEMLESEYVGDSEYAENECDIDCYPSPPDYQQILGIPETPEEEGYQLPPNIHVHPDQYLPHYNISQEQASNERLLPPPYWDNDNESGSDYSGNEDNESVVHYGFPPHQTKFSTEGCITDSEYNGDYDRSAASVDNMSVSMGDFTSTNASCSDISGLCEIEDSEINLSDEESVDEVDETTPLNLGQGQGHLHTQV